jgi:DNA repair protein RadC
LHIKEAKGELFKNSRDVFGFMHAEAKIDRECARVIILNGKNQTIEKELVSMGTVNYAHLGPCEIFHKAIITGAAAIVVVHNPPSRAGKSPQADLECSDGLKTASEILQVPLLEFIIIGKTYTSFADVVMGGFKYFFFLRGGHP